MNGFKFSNTSHTIHKEGYCSMYGICGYRSDNKPLNCPNNVPAVTPSEELSVKIQSLCPMMTSDVCCTESQFDILKNQVKLAIPFLVGCPSCLRNFLNFFCMLSCSPNQSMFINVTSIAQAGSEELPSVKSIQYFVSNETGTQFFESCKNVKFAAMNTRAMDFIGAGANDYKSWFSFMGTEADVGMEGSPYTIEFPDQIASDADVSFVDLPILSCSDSVLSCSCGDCPDSDACSDTKPPAGNPDYICTIDFYFWKIRCTDFSLAMLYGIFLFFLIFESLSFPLGWNDFDNADVAIPLIDEKYFFDDYMELQESEVGLKTKIFESNANENIQNSTNLPFMETFLRSHFRSLGIYIANNTYKTLSISFFISFLLCCGLINFSIETNPEKLWVSSGSQSAVEKSFFEKNLFPFYRIEELILSTKKENNNSLPILTENNLKLLFEIQKKTDSLSVNFSNEHVSLSDLCFNPMGTGCATQSILQYWQMSEDIFSETEPIEHAEFCFQHFSSSRECLSAFSSPMDPLLVLGGFSNDDYMNATAFIITYPVTNYVNKNEKNYQKAVEWEKAFINLAKGELTDMANEFDLMLTFSSESSIEFELSRESSADIMTILISYLVMFVYIAFTLGDISSNLIYNFVSSKVLLAFFGVFIVAISVLSALGLCSFFQIKSTLIIAEVIPFLILAVGVDNMCIMVHAMKRQEENENEYEYEYDYDYDYEKEDESEDEVNGVVMGGSGGERETEMKQRFVNRSTKNNGLKKVKEDNGENDDNEEEEEEEGEEEEFDKNEMNSKYKKQSKLHGEIRDDVEIHVDEESIGHPTVKKVKVKVKGMKEEKENGKRKKMGEKLGNALAEVGPSITLASSAEFLSFCVGILTPMPACRVFCLFAATSIFLNFCLQITAFVAFVALDFERFYKNRLDCFPCFILDPRKFKNKKGTKREENFLVKYMKDFHAPFLSLSIVKFFVLAIFVGMFILSIALSTRISIGLEQTTALPRDSYLQGYFGNISSYMRVGAPVYFVVKDFNYSDHSPHTNNICSIGGCNSNSLLNQVSESARMSESSYIARPAASWLDDFLTWLSPLAFSCCRQFPNSTYCPPDDQPPCVNPFDFGDEDSVCLNCTTCFLESELHSGRPNSQQVKEKLPVFLNALPSATCAKGGVGAYSHSLNLLSFDRGLIHSSEFRTYHTPASKQSDYINALKEIKKFVKKVSHELKMDIFAYSVFYIYFEQYLNIVQTLFLSLFLAMSMIFFTCWLFTGSMHSSLIIVLVLSMIIVNLIGVMSTWQIQLNAISIVNLVMSIGICVEFCVHIIHSFSLSSGSKSERVKNSLSTIGASVLSGITLTKFVGVSVLYFSKSEIFEIYYFRMYFSLVILGALHGLIFLPVLLSLIGPAPLSPSQVQNHQTYVLGKDSPSIPEPNLLLPWNDEFKTKSEAEKAGFGETNAFQIVSKPEP